ncbi:MAG: 2-C-methyl-D-erythritol 4-phosphate cytidylyltransferase [Butyrivibrio sp.]|nr:2-C-methyl-D-erythritol 4-phosphate cytidylyltransferase [Butyrivibrio sp.]
MKNIVVLLAAGTGSRFGSQVHKQFYKLDGREVISFSIEQLKKVKNMDKLIVVLEKNEVESGEIARKYDVEVITGGDSRAESFNNALEYIDKKYGDCEKVIFHEAARPLVKARVFEKYFDLLDEYDYVESCKKITDSLGSLIKGQFKREDFYLIQAPEAYRYKLLKENFDVNSEIYFAAQQLPDSSKGYRFFDIKNNYKLTYQEDIDLIRYMLSVQKDE